MHYLQFDYSDIKSALYAHGYGNNQPLIDLVLTRAKEIFGKIVSPLDIGIEHAGTAHSHIFIDLGPFMPHTGFDGSTILALHHSEWSRL